MHVFTKDLFYSIFVSIKLFLLHLYIHITFHLQKAFYPQTHGSLNRSLFCRKIASQRGKLSKNRKLGELECYQTLKLESI